MGGRPGETLETGRDQGRLQRLGETLETGGDQDRPVETLETGELPFECIQTTGMPVRCHCAYCVRFYCACDTEVQGSRCKPKVKLRCAAAATNFVDDAMDFVNIMDLWD